MPDDDADAAVRLLVGVDRRVRADERRVDRTGEQRGRGFGAGVERLQLELDVRAELGRERAVLHADDRGRVRDVREVAEPQRDRSGGARAAGRAACRRAVLRAAAARGECQRERDGDRERGDHRSGVRAPQGSSLHGSSRVGISTKAVEKDRVTVRLRQALSGAVEPVRITACGSRRRRTTRCGRRSSSRRRRRPANRSKANTSPGCRTSPRTSSRTSSRSCAEPASSAPAGGPTAATSSPGPPPRSPSPTCCARSRARWRRCRASARTSSRTAAPAERLPEVWVALRASLRDVLEHVTLADIARGRLPSVVKERTRPKGRVARALASRVLLRLHLPARRGRRDYWRHSAARPAGAHAGGRGARPAHRLHVLGERRRSRRRHAVRPVLEGRRPAGRARRVAVRTTAYRCACSTTGTTSTAGAKPGVPTRFTCAVAVIAAACPRLRLGHENFLTRFGDDVGLRDVELEYDDFNRRFRVKCDDQKFAFSLARRADDAVAARDRRLRHASKSTAPGCSWLDASSIRRAGSISAPGSTQFHRQDPARRVLDVPAPLIAYARMRMPYPTRP